METSIVRAGEAVASKVGAGERDWTGDGVEQECTRDIYHSEAE